MKANQLLATNRAIEALGGIAKTAKRYKVSMNAVQNWRARGVPRRLVRQIGKDSGVPCKELLPELYA